VGTSWTSTLQPGLGPYDFHLFGPLKTTLVATNLLMTKRLKRRCRSGWDNSKKCLCRGFRRTSKTMGQVYQCWWRICRDIIVSPTFEYHMIYVSYLFMTYLLTLPHITSCLCLSNNTLIHDFPIQLFLSFSSLHECCSSCPSSAAS
jgi:hypothetical protein